MSVHMSLAENKTYQLFSSFMPRRKEIKLLKEDEVLDLRVYSADYFSDFNPGNSFVKWALVEVSDFGQLPESMQTFELEGGRYAVFKAKGSEAPALYQHIFTSWLPQSVYALDDRPHFEILQVTGKPNDPDADEFFYIPIKAKESQ
ncbi:GyrI-like domain-containing protein [Flavobacteriaceae bacterium R33]|uniref:GyrI-like domain-containing protein n=2 Tax=Poritiphilus flavus TaxID=2697053 RepID=A0A6L9EFN9_9FLAO|nr:GyrI-like domain-containing protein [Poritiphilus flavus]